MIGPFTFLDHMGPADFQPGEGINVRPHPHIGLATVTYLLEGEILHRDSVGSVQTIRPGEVNWMTAGSGIAHSERTPPEARATGASLFGLQTWVALPTAREEVAPAFTHYAARQIPSTSDAGATLTLIAGTADGLHSPVQTFSDMIYADLVLQPGATYQFRAEHIERAIYVVSGSLEVTGQTGAFPAGQLVILRPGAEVVLTTQETTRLMLVGGEPFAEPRHIYWNFVSSRRERIEQAKQDWKSQRFAPVPAEVDFIPLPADVPGQRPT
jgi:redox-sensitive bicupin YhaK (pirin superfamily)